MTEANKRHNIGQELDKAERELALGDMARQAGSPDLAVARAYYGALHYARALLLTVGLEARSHTGVNHLMQQHFVQTGKLAPDVARWLPRLESQRLDADYDVKVVFTDEGAEDALGQARQLAAAVRVILTAGGYV